MPKIFTDSAGLRLIVLRSVNERDHAAMVPAVQILWVERPRDPRADGRGRQSPSLKAQLYTDTTPVCLLTLSPCQGLRPQENESNHRSCNPVPRARGPFRAAALAYPGQIAIILLSPLLAEGAGLERCGSRKLHEHDAPAQRDQAGDEHADGGNPQHVPSR